ncbi:hypothetical protein SK128_006584, partial [Halocaridina rubra]
AHDDFFRFNIPILLVYERYISLQNLAEIRPVIVFKGRYKLKDVLKLSPGNYEVRNIDVEQQVLDDYPAVTFYLRIAHKPNLTIVISYVPSYLLLVIMYATLFFPLHMTMVRIVSILACLLGVSVIFWVLVIQDSLPHSPHGTFLEVWFWIVFVYGVIVLIFHSVISSTLTGKARRPSS